MVKPAKRVCTFTPALSEQRAVVFPGPGHRLLQSSAVATVGVEVECPGLALTSSLSLRLGEEFQKQSFLSNLRVSLSL